MKRLLLAVLFLPLFYGYSFTQSLADDTLITLERDPGHWGRVGSAPCPFYKLTIFADGAVELEPKEYNETGTVSGKIIKSRIDGKQVKNLVSEFEKIDFNSLNSTFENKENRLEDCPEYGTDDVTVTTSLTLKGRVKRVEHYHGCQNTESLMKLTNLENKIDEAVNIKQWFDCHLVKNRIKLSGLFD